MSKLYKIVATDFGPLHGGTGTWHTPKGSKPGEWMPKIENVQAYHRGYHLIPAKAIIEWLPPSFVAGYLCEAEGCGASDKDGDKIAFAEARLLKIVGVLDEKSLRLAAADIAERVLPIFYEVLPNDNRPALAIQAARDFAVRKIERRSQAAGDAAWAAGDAAWAARDAAWAAGDAAWAAAWAAWAAAAAAAARAAARAAAAAAAAWAAGDAAWAAAGAARAAARAAAGDANAKIIIAQAERRLRDLENIMSDDLVKRLRREAGTLTTMYEAADEIERLRRLNSELTATHNKMVVWDAKQADEIERLRADNKRLADKLLKIAEWEKYT